MFVNLSSSVDINSWVRESVNEALASYPLPVNAGPVAVDIGANVGGFCILAHGKFEKIYAFEPEKANYAILTQVLDQLNITNVEAFNTAVYSESNQTLDLKVHATADSLKTYGGKHSRDVTIVEVDNECITSIEETCETISLKDLMTTLKLDHIDYLKMDCEGAEYAILENFDDFHKITSIVMELHGFYGPERRGRLLELLSTHYYFMNIYRSGRWSIEEQISDCSQDYKDYKDVDNFMFLHKSVSWA